MENRVAVISIIVKEGTEVSGLNQLLHEFAPHIVGRMGLPYRKRSLNLISVAVDAPEAEVEALSKKLSQLTGVAVKTVYAPEN